MRITIYAIGRMKKSPMYELIQEYTKRLYWSLTIKEIEVRSGLSSHSLKNEEGQLLLKAIPTETYVVALDEKGEGVSSQEFSSLMETIQHHHDGKACFIIGGVDGLSDEVKTRAYKLISFGRTTWPHMMVRVMLCEQIYRAQQILKGHPYHREG